LVNRLHALLFRPENGWDPVPTAHVEAYAAHEWDHLNEELVSDIEKWTDGLAGKRVLDLGAGPGHYSAAFARRGAIVTWHDVSRGYLNLASARAKAEGLKISYSLGYLESASRFTSDPFDLVFNRGCWNYSMADAGFARLLYRLTRLGGHGFVDTPIFAGSESFLIRRAQRWLYDSRVVKIGHPFPRRGVMLEHMRRLPVRIVDRSTVASDRIYFTR
jgi:2-polyprenyl-3-methyl-5-hydroxy-6-metoxy-1,4-benzoquinol methylase